MALRTVKNKINIKSSTEFVLKKEAIVVRITRLKMRYCVPLSLKLL